MLKLLERNPPHLLFADDDAATLDVYRAYIKTLNWSADYTRTARELIAQVNTNCVEGGRCYDALICDVNFFDSTDDGPRITGVTAAKVIRETHPDLPVIFVTAYSSYLVRETVKEIPAAEMFEKPVDFESLFERIAYLIRWNRVISPAQVTNERRLLGRPNVSGNNRRRTDGALRIPPVLENLINQVREEKRERTDSPGGH